MALIMIMFFAIFAGGVAHTQANMEYSQVLEVVEIEDNLIYMIDSDAG